MNPLPPSPLQNQIVQELAQFEPLVRETLVNLSKDFPGRTIEEMRFEVASKSVEPIPQSDEYASLPLPVREAIPTHPGSKFINLQVDFNEPYSLSYSLYSQYVENGQLHEVLVFKGKVPINFDVTSGPRPVGDE